MPIIILIALLLPMLAHAQVMRCPDGSYRDSCAGGETYEPGDVSGYTAPRSHQQPLAPVQRQQQAPSRQQSQPSRSREAPVPSRLMSTAERARDMGISEGDLIRARSRGELLHRMHRHDVDHIMGRPDKVDDRSTSTRSCEGLWYRDSRRSWHTLITMCDGRLQRVTTR
jgi:hypothetical protein